ncbi:hypothetical protein L7F22_055596 [Adiantum nelumboides]|nr:hypothetical protein [Adiantum nelumboides]
MAHQQQSGAQNEQTTRKAPNAVGISEYEGPLPSPQCDSPFHARLAKAIAHHQVSRLHKAWASVCNALPRQDVPSPKEPVESNGFLKESSSDDKCSHHINLEALPLLGKHIVLYMSEQSLARGQKSLCAENSGGCSCGSKTDSFHNMDDGFVPAFVGVFLQTHPKERGRLSDKFVDGSWAQRSLHNLAFARLRGEPGMICSRPQVHSTEASQGPLDMASSPLVLASSPKLLMRSLREQILHAVPHQQQQNVPDKEVLTSVQDFFMYTESEGRKVFEELDRDSDGKLTLDDLTMAMKKMKLPLAYAKDFMQGGQSLWRAKHYGWSDFCSLLHEKEPVIVQLFNSLGVSNSGTVKSSHVKSSLVKAGLSATEADVSAMMKFLAEDESGGLKYGQFRRFMLLLPSEQLTQDPWSVWLKAATMNGMESFSEDIHLPVLNYVSLLARNLTHHFDSAKERAYL